MSAAQRVFDVDELLRNILSYIPPRKDWATIGKIGREDKPFPPNSLVAAAHVNHQWRDVALDFLWSDIEDYDLTKMVRTWCKPSSRVSELDDVDQVFTLEYHARRIRSLYVGLEGWDAVLDALSCISTDIWKDMGKLRTLVLMTDWRPRHFDVSRRLLSPTLSTISFTLSTGFQRLPDQSHWWSAEHEAFFSDLLRHAGTNLHVFHFAFCNSIIWQLLEDRILTVLVKMPNLKTVYVPTFALSPTFVMRCAATHPTIRIRSSNIYRFTGNRVAPPWDLIVYHASHVWRVVEGQVTNTPPPDGLDGLRFSNRWSPSELSICTDTAGLHRFVQHYVDVKILTRLEIALSSVRTIDGLRAALRIIGRDALTLYEFRLAAPDPDAPLRVRPSFGEPILPRLDWHTLAPLTACTRLEVFVAMWDTPLAMTEADFDELAHAWPRLRTLHIESGRPHPSDPMAPLPSMAVLATLSRCCPLLQMLQVPLTPVAPADVPSGFRTFEHLTRVAICVGPPFTNDTSSMAATHKFLWDILPARTHDLKWWGPYALWRITWHPIEDPARTSPHNVDVWCGWLWGVDKLMRGLRDLWLERGRTA